MSGFASIFQEIKFSGDSAAQDSVAYFPPSLNGTYIEFTVYVEFSSGTSTGKVQIETAFPSPNVQLPTYAGTWAAVGSTIDFAAASSQKYASVTGVFGMLRCRIQTAVTGGTVKAYVVAASHVA